MFSTLQANSEGTSFDEVEVGPEHLACVHCRAKKVGL
jgi:hypothetical protein